MRPQEQPRQRSRPCWRHAGAPGAQPAARPALQAAQWRLQEHWQLQLLDLLLLILQAAEVAAIQLGIKGDLSRSLGWARYPRAEHECLLNGRTGLLHGSGFQPNTLTQKDKPGAALDRWHTCRGALGGGAVGRGARAQVFPLGQRVFRHDRIGASQGYRGHHTCRASQTHYRQRKAESWVSGKTFSAVLSRPALVAVLCCLVCMWVIRLHSTLSVAKMDAGSRGHNLSIIGGVDSCAEGDSRSRIFSARMVSTLRMQIQPQATAICMAMRTQSQQFYA